MVNISRSAFKSIVVEDENGNEVLIREDDIVTFNSDLTGEVKTGVVVKISGKDAKTKLQIRPMKSEFDEIHSVASMAEGSLQLVTSN